MNRRQLLACGAGALLSGAGRSYASSKRVGIQIDAERRLATIPGDFVGLGYEISSVAIPNLLTAEDRTYVNLVRTLSPQGVIRIGGNTSDDSSYAARGKAVSAPKGTVVDDAAIQQLGTFLNATNWRLIWGLNLGTTDQQQAVAEAEAVWRAARSHLVAFEIGNEPDLFGRGTGHRARSYNYDAYIEEFRRFKAAIRAKLPDASFAGPDVASATDWVTRFAADEGKDLRLLTHHYYRQCAGPTSTLGKLLHADPKLQPELAVLRAASTASKVPYRICETNSFCGGGQPGVSDTFGAALWVLDFMFLLANAGCAGVNIETGVNQLGFISSYSPIRPGKNGGPVAAAEYYGMLAFAQAGSGDALAVDCDASGANITAYAAQGEGRHLSLAVINKEEAIDADVNVSIPKGLGRARVLRLAAPSLQSKEQITFGGSAVGPDGRWGSATSERLDSPSLRVPAASAVILKWGRS